MKIEELLNAQYEKFSGNEKDVCYYLTRHFRECSKMTIDEFAACCHVSRSVLVRFAQKIGLSGYSELKARIKIELQEQSTDVDGLLQTMTDSYHKMMDDLNRKSPVRFFEMLYAAKRVFVFGSGSSQARAASEMKRIFLPVKEIIHLYGRDLQDAIQKTAAPEDLVIIISLSGESKQIVELAGALRTRQVPVVSVTGLRNNTLASLAAENLYIHSVRLPMEYGIEYESTTPYFILIEYLFLAYQNYLAQEKKRIP